MAFRFHITPHYAQRLEDRALLNEKVRNVVAYGSKRFLRDGMHGGKVYEITEKNSGKPQIVIAEIRKKDCWLISTWS